MLYTCSNCNCCQDVRLQHFIKNCFYLSQMSTNAPHTRTILCSDDKQLMIKLRLQRLQAETCFLHCSGLFIAVIHVWCLRLRQGTDRGLWVMANCTSLTAVFESKLNGVGGTGMRSHKPHWGRVSKTSATLHSHTEGLCLAMELETFDLSASL